MAAATFSGTWPSVGALGSFVGGSATFSNLMFLGFQVSVVDQLNLPHGLIVTLQMLGANAGNMICVFIVVAVASVAVASVAGVGGKGRAGHPADGASDALRLYGCRTLHAPYAGG